MGKRKTSAEGIPILVQSQFGRPIPLMTLLVRGINRAFPKTRNIRLRITAGPHEGYHGKKQKKCQKPLFPHSRSPVGRNSDQMPTASDEIPARESSHLSAHFG